MVSPLPRVVGRVHRQAGHGRVGTFLKAVSGFLILVVTDVDVEFRHSNGVWSGTSGKSTQSTLVNLPVLVTLALTSADPEGIGEALLLVSITAIILHVCHRVQAAVETVTATIPSSDHHILILISQSKGSGEH